jgi:hypothetical protein
MLSVRLPIASRPRFFFEKPVGGCTGNMIPRSPDAMSVVSAEPAVRALFRFLASLCDRRPGRRWRVQRRTRPPGDSGARWVNRRIRCKPADPGRRSRAMAAAPPAVARRPAPAGPWPARAARAPTGTGGVCERASGKSRSGLRRRRSGLGPAQPGSGAGGCWQQRRHRLAVPPPAPPATPPGRAAGTGAGGRHPGAAGELASPATRPANPADAGPRP